MRSSPIPCEIINEKNDKGKGGRVWKGWYFIPLKINDLLGFNFKLAIWGAGTLTAQLLEQTALGSSDCLRFIIDNDPKKSNLHMNNIIIKNSAYLSKQIDENEIDKIIIGSWSSQNEIYQQIIKLGIAESNIIRLFELNHDWYK